jgi:hypothetical protein
LAAAALRDARRGLQIIAFAATCAPHLRRD